MRLSFEPGRKRRYRVMRDVVVASPAQPCISRVCRAVPATTVKLKFANSVTEKSRITRFHHLVIDQTDPRRPAGVTGSPSQ